MTVRVVLTLILALLLVALAGAGVLAAGEPQGRGGHVLAYCALGVVVDLLLIAVTWLV